MVLGFIYENSGSLLAVVFPHLLLNIVSMYRYKKEWSKHGTRAFISKFPLLNSKGNS
jgi:membrane protease YdiL (CAAX protease family)